MSDKSIVHKFLNFFDVPITGIQQSDVDDLLSIFQQTENFFLYMFYHL